MIKRLPNSNEQYKDQNVRVRTINKPRNHSRILALINKTEGGKVHLISRQFKQTNSGGRRYSVRRRTCQ